MEIIGYNRNLLQTAEIQLNNLMGSDISKFYYMSPVMINNQQSKFLQPMLNIPAVEKLYFDTCFYFFVLHRMNPELENPSDFVKILLTHLDIEDKYSDVVDITVLSEEEKENIAKKELVDYLESLKDTTIVVPDENGSDEELFKLKEIINNVHIKLYSKSLDTHWTETDRFFRKKE